MVKTIQKYRVNGITEKKYDLCVMNNIVKGQQCTILWNFDDMKMLHVDSDIISGIISDIDTEYVEISKMTST